MKSSVIKVTLCGQNNTTSLSVILKNNLLYKDPSQTSLPISSAKFFAKAQILTILDWTSKVSVSNNANFDSPEMVVGEKVLPNGTYLRFEVDSGIRVYKIAYETE